jgi:hypothetical protein
MSMLLLSATDGVETTLKIIAAVTALAVAITGVLTAIGSIRRRSDGTGGHPESAGDRRPPTEPADRPKPAADAPPVVTSERSEEPGPGQQWQGRSIPPSPRIVVITSRQDRDPWYAGWAQEDDPNLWKGKAKVPDPPRIQKPAGLPSSQWWKRTEESDLVRLGGSRHGSS